MEKILTMRFHSPVGELMIGCQGGELCMCDWASSQRKSANERRLKKHLRADLEESRSQLLEQVVEQLKEYFAGRRREFDIPVVMAGTDFQRAVWQELMKVPYGTTVSYAELARRVGRPGAVRAVASAVGSNPISVIVPCHRVIGSSGALTGYAGGLAAKSALLALENPPASRK